MRFTMKAGKSSALTGFFSSLTTTSRTVRKVSSSVAMPRISSTSPIIGTGFMKCMPRNLPGRSVTEASRVTEIDEVLVASSTLGGRPSHSLLKMSRFTPSFSVAASTTRSQSANCLKSVPVWIRRKAASLSSGRMMPLPIWPAPMTPMRLIMIDTPALLLFHRGRQLGHDLEQVAHDAIIGHLKNRGFLVLVDRDDGLAVLHPGEMLDRAGDADGYIEIGCHHLAGLA